MDCDCKDVALNHNWEKVITDLVLLSLTYFQGQMWIGS